MASLPAHVAGAIDEISACHVTPEKDYLVFDRRAHAVYRVPRDGRGGAKKILQIGFEKGKILSPVAFASAPDGTFLVADAPTGQERIQIFFYMGASAGGFTLPVRSTPRLTLNDIVLNGIGSIDYTGKTILASHPDATGALITEYAVDGRVSRTIGTLRATGHEADRNLHFALNGGFPLAIPGGGYYFVFAAGVPAFRKYAANGDLLYERHIEGPEIDAHLRALPTVWPRRRIDGGEVPIVPPAVRTAAVDAVGNLWLSLVTPLTYVYGASGDKERVIEFRAAGVVAPTDLFFTPEGQLLVSPGCYLFNPM